MKNTKIDVGGIVAGVIELLVGILLLISPLGFTNGIIIAAGVILCAVGIKFIVNYLCMDALSAAKSKAMFKGLICLVAGVFCILKYRWFVATFPILTVIYGVIILLSGLGKVQLAADMIRMKLRKWFLAGISAVITIACSVVILMNPFTTTKILWIFTGVALIVEAVLDIVVAIFDRGDNKNNENEEVTDEEVTNQDNN